MLLFLYLCFLIFEDFIDLLLIESESEWASLARYVYIYKEFVIVTEAPQCNRMTATGYRQQNNNTQMYK